MPMYKIHRYDVSLTPGLTNVRMPMGAKILSAVNRNDHIDIWAMFDVSMETQFFGRLIAVVFTGQPFEMQGSYGYRYIASTVDEINIVRHIFEFLDTTQQLPDGSLNAETQARLQTDNFEF